jgi:hypothetical protein
MMRGGIQAVSILALMVSGGAAGVVRADSPPAPPRGETARQALLDQLDDARINRDLLEMEVAGLRTQIQTMMAVLRETELMPIQGFAQGAVIGGNGPQERESNIKQYRKMLDRACGDFALKSKELFREQRRAAALEAQLGPTLSYLPASPLPPAEGPPRAERLQKDAERLLELIRKGIEAWRRDPPSTPREQLAPGERSEPPQALDPSLRRDAERLLDLLRRGVDAWQGH